jgi:hypothetical protein
MKKFALIGAAGLAATVLLSGCIAVPYDNGPHYRRGAGYYNQGPVRGDRDGDGVPNRFDQRPNNPQRY